MLAALERVVPTRAPRSTIGAALAVVGVIMVAVLAVWLWMRPKPVLAERDSVVIADLDNKTGDPVFDGTLRQALMSETGRSRYLSIVSEDSIAAALRSMGRLPGGGLARGVAREVCERTGAKAVLAGSISSLGSRYFIGVDTIGCAGGEALASEYAEAESKERVLTTLGHVVSKMRGRLGESLASVRRLSPLAEATTLSLEALKTYSVALHERAMGKDALPLLERAIQLDPEFAAAHFTLARVYMGRGQDSKAEAAITKAYELRGHTSERERLGIEGLYHRIVSWDAEQGIAIGTLGVQLYPHEANVWRWSMAAYWCAGELDKALEVTRREMQADPSDGASYFDNAILLLALGRTTEARAVLDSAVARGAGAEVLPFARYVLAARRAISTRWSAQPSPLGESRPSSVP